MKLAILVFMLVLPLAAYASDEASIVEQCGDASQVGMRDCLAKRAAESQRALSDTEKKAAAAIAGWDEDEKFIRAGQARLAASSKAFEHYREAQCALSAALGGGAVAGALELRRLSCVTAANEARVEHLRRMSESLPRR